MKKKVSIIEQVDFYDVGHGNEISLIIKEPNGKKNIIVNDFGDSGTQHTELLENCRRIKEETGEIPHLTGIISHMHQDHKGGLKKLLQHNNKEFIFDRIYIPETYVKDFTYIKLLEEKVNIVELKDKEEKVEVLKYAMLYYDDKTIKELSKTFGQEITEEAQGKKEAYKEELKKVLDDGKKILKNEKTTTLTKEVDKQLKDEGKFLRALVNKGLDVKPISPEKDEETKKNINPLKKEEIYGIKTTFHYPTKDAYRDFFGTTKYIESMEEILKFDNVCEYLQSTEDLDVLKNQDNKDILAKRQGRNYLKKCCTPGTFSGKVLKKDVTPDNELRFRFIARAISDEKNMQNIFSMFEDGTGKKVICPGDMELPQELMILKNPEINLACNALVIGHHELLTSSFVSYLEKISSDSEEKGINPEEILVVSFTGGVDLDKIRTQEYADTGTVNAKLYQTGLPPVNRTFENHIKMVRDENLEFKVIDEKKSKEYNEKLQNFSFENFSPEEIEIVKGYQDRAKNGENLADYLREHIEKGYEGAEKSTLEEHLNSIEELRSQGKTFAEKIDELSKICSRAAKRCNEIKQQEELEEREGPTR